MKILHSYLLLSLVTFAFAAPAQAYDHHSRDRRGRDYPTVFVRHDKDRDRHHDRDWWMRYHRNDRYVFLYGDYIANPYYGQVYYDEPYNDDYRYVRRSDYFVVEDVQKRLLRKGYYTGPIDGIIGPETKGAVASFQRDRGMRGSGRIDDDTLAELGL